MGPKNNLVHFKSVVECLLISSWSSSQHQHAGKRWRVIPSLPSHIVIHFTFVKWFRFGLARLMGWNLCSSLTPNLCSTIPKSLFFTVYSFPSLLTTLLSRQPRCQLRCWGHTQAQWAWVKQIGLTPLACSSWNIVIMAAQGVSDSKITI